MSPQRELGGEQSLGHPPTHVGGSWDTTLWAHENVLGVGSQKRVGKDQKPSALAFWGERSKWEYGGLFACGVISIKSMPDKCFGNNFSADVCS
jgi:hypothetical protein